MTQPRYPQALLRRLVWETKDLDDLVDLCRLYRELEAQGDIVITYRLKAEVAVQTRLLVQKQKPN